MKGGTKLHDVLIGELNATSIPTREYPSGTQNILLVLAPQVLPGYSVISLSSHSRKKTIWWLIARSLFQEVSQKEKTILKYLTVGDPEFVHRIVDFSVSTISCRTRSTAANLLVVLFPELTERFLASFQPQIQTFQVWTEIKKLPSKRFIGIGYKDHGSLASSPSWKSQMLEVPEESDITERVNFILSIVQFSSPPSLVGLVRPQKNQADESKSRTKRKGKG